MNRYTSFKSGSHLSVSAKLQYYALRFGAQPASVSRALGDMPVKGWAGDQDTAVKVGPHDVVIRHATRKKDDRWYDMNAWDIRFSPPAPYSMAESLLENIAFVARLAEGTDVGWTRQCLFDSNGLQEDVFIPYGQPSHPRLIERMRLSDDNLHSLLRSAVSWTTAPPEMPLKEAINLINEVESQKTRYVSLNMAGLMVLLERLALNAARMVAPARGWTFDATAFDLKDGKGSKGKWVTLRAKLDCLLNAAGIVLDDDCCKRIIVVRNDTFHGKPKKIDLLIVCHCVQALAHLLFLVTLGLMGYRGEYNRLAIGRSPLQFPAQVSQDMDAVRAAIMAYPS